MTDAADRPQSPTNVADAVAQAWTTWVQASTAAMSGSTAAARPFQELTAALRGYTGAMSAPIRDFARQQRELAESMEEWARLQHQLADHVQAWAQQQRQLADGLDAMLAPLTAFTPPAE